MNLPNTLTLTRIILTPFFVLAILWNFPFHYLVALVIFSIASITDMLDGKIARSRNLVTNFGKFCDPLADKILVLSALLCFVQNNLCSCIIVIIVLFREFAVSSIRLLAAAEGKVVAANMWGKVKTVTQIIAIILIFVLQFVLELMIMGIIPISPEGIEISSTIFCLIGEIALWISTIFCIISGVIYIIDNKKFISQK
ncbi:MAG: CDP-diacylglycerol--glycerol-3-phosphate 3-phosphatidyltransferase [Ruminococcus sp.]